MTNVLRRTLVLALAFPPAATYALCSCECVDGAPRTICTKLDEAAADPSLCGLDPPLCSPVSVPVSRARFEPPPGAQDCREAALADASRPADPAVVKVCDTLQKPTTP